MKVFAISDLHLSVNNPKPMDIFGPAWENYIEKIFVDWREKVGEEDLVLLAGDFSWAMKLEDSIADFQMLKDLPGKKIIIRGNHDLMNFISPPAGTKSRKRAKTRALPYGRVPDRNKFAEP